MSKPKFLGKSVTVVSRSDRHTRVRVECEYEGAKLVAFTDISEGQDTNTDLEGFAVRPSDEFVECLHEYLSTTWHNLYVEEMERICG